MPPTIEASMQDEPMTECGFRPSGLSSVSRLKQGRPGQTDDLPAILNQIDPVYAQGVDDDHRPVVVVTVWRRTARQFGVDGLHDDCGARGDTGLQHTQLFQEPPRQHDGEGRALARSEASAITAGSVTARQHVALAHDTPQRLDELGLVF
jgi:hypothetical protein